VTGEDSTERTPAADGLSEQRAAVQRALMERARIQAAHEPEQPPRLLRNAIAFAVTLAVVAIVLLGLDAFLTAMQKFMETKIVDPPPAATDPIPAYVVQPDISPQPPADQGPRPSQAPAPDTSPATP
jgi:hypothetical protein